MSTGRQDRDPWGESGGDWKEFGLVCLHCGQAFYGGIEEAMKPLLAHSASEHPGDMPDYAATATPTSYEGEKQARRMTTISEAVSISKILQEHGSGWYFWALHYGAQEALARIADLDRIEPERLRDRVRALAA